MLDLIQKGGVVLVLILALSVVAVVIIIERLLYFRRIRGDESVLLNRLKSTIAKGHYEEALAICEASPSPITNLTKVGIEHRGYPESIIRSMVSDAANMEVPKLERFLSALTSFRWLVSSSDSELCYRLNILL